MVLKNPIERAFYHREYDKIHRPHINKMQRIRRYKAKLKLAMEKYEMDIAPIEAENWFIKNG